MLNFILGPGIGKRLIVPSLPPPPLKIANKLGKAIRKSKNKLITIFFMAIFFIFLKKKIKSPKRNKGVKLYCLDKTKRISQKRLPTDKDSLVSFLFSKK